jgi:hypothetical protein
MATWRVFSKLDTKERLERRSIMIGKVFVGAVAVGCWLAVKRNQTAGVGSDPNTYVKVSGRRCQKCEDRHAGVGVSVQVGRSPYNLHHANASRFKAASELMLLEDHILNDPCTDCMNKHSMTAAQLMREAAGLYDGELGDLAGADLIEDIRTQLSSDPDIALANKTRDIRKKIQRKLNLSNKDHDFKGNGQ